VRANSKRNAPAYIAKGAVEYAKGSDTRFYRPAPRPRRQLRSLRGLYQNDSLSHVDGSHPPYVECLAAQEGCRVCPGAERLCHVEGELGVLAYRRRMLRREDHYTPPKRSGFLSRRRRDSTPYPSESHGRAKFKPSSARAPPMGADSAPSALTFSRGTERSPASHGCSSSSVPVEYVRIIEHTRQAPDSVGNPEAQLRKAPAVRVQDQIDSDGGHAMTPCAQRARRAPEEFIRASTSGRRAMSSKNSTCTILEVLGSRTTLEDWAVKNFWTARAIL